MLDRGDLTAAVLTNDRLVEGGTPVPAILMTLGIEPMGATYVAEARALRMALLASGADLRLGEAPRLQKRQRDLIPVYAGIWTDGLAAGIRAYYDALSS